MKKLSVIILSILCLTLVTVPVFADETPVDISVSINSSTYNNVYLCGDPNDSNSPSCSGYLYMTVSVTGSEPNVTGTWNSRVRMNNSLTAWYGLSSSNSTIKVLLPENVTFLYTNNFTDYFSQNPNAVVTFTLSAGDGCTCPTCPTCPDPNEPTIVRMFKDGFWAIATAFVSLIVPVLALFLVFRLVHDFFWGRG